MEWLLALGLIGLFGRLLDGDRKDDDEGDTPASIYSPDSGSESSSTGGDGGGDG